MNIVYGGGGRVFALLRLGGVRAFTKEFSHISVGEDFLLEEALSDRFEEVLFGGEEIESALIGSVDDISDFIIDDFSSVRRVEAMREVEFRLVGFEGEETDASRHAIFGNLIESDIGDSIQVVLSAGGNILEDDLFSDAATEGEAHAIE